MAATILSTLNNSTVTTVADQENVTEQCGFLHFQQVVPSTPGTSIAMTVNNSQNIGVRAVPSVQIRAAGILVAPADYVLTYSATSGVVTIANGTTFALAQSQVIELLVVTQPIGP